MKSFKFAVFAFILAVGTLSAAAQSGPDLPSPEMIRPDDPEAGPAKAGSAKAGEAQITDREKIQQKRIADGVRTGELTNAEAALLLKKQAEIRKLEEDAKADGIVTDAERLRIHRELNKASREIRRKRKNLPQSLGPKE